jgi:hypothetical protein
MTDVQTRAAPITVARLREWLLSAKPGATLVWARGPSSVLDAGPVVSAFVQHVGHGSTDKAGNKLPGLGLVVSNFSRDPATREGRYLITRTARPVPLGGRI